MRRRRREAEYHARLAEREERRAEDDAWAYRLAWSRTFAGQVAYAQFAFRELARTVSASLSGVPS